MQALLRKRTSVTCFPPIVLILSSRLFVTTSSSSQINQMRAIVVRTRGPSDELKLETNFEKPSTIPAGSLLVKNAYAGINYIDTYQRSGLYTVPLPLVPGREGSGTIVAVGEGVTDFTVGQQVAYLGPNSYGEYSVVPAWTTLALPSNLNLEQGAALLLQGMTAAYLVKYSHPVQPGQFVIVPAAAGGTGSLIVRLSKKAGGRVIAIVGSEDKAAIARKSGAEFVLNHRSDDLAARISEITQGKGANVVYDGVGKALYKTFIKSLGRFGSYIYFGNASGKIDTIDPFDFMPKTLRFMRPSLMGYVETREEFLQLAQVPLDLLTEQPDALLVHKVYELADAKQAHDDLESGSTIGKLLLRI